MAKEVLEHVVAKFFGVDDCLFFVDNDLIFLQMSNLEALLIFENKLSDEAVFHEVDLKLQANGTDLRPRCIFLNIFSLLLPWTSLFLFIGIRHSFQLYYNSNMLLVALFLLLIAQSAALTGSQAASFCHCDLTASFCDFGCCCDSDCSSVIAVSFRVFLVIAIT